MAKFALSIKQNQNCFNMAGQTKLSLKVVINCSMLLCTQNNLN